MASVRKFKGSANWYACYTRADGTRAQKSTGKPDKHEAMQVALAYEKASRAAREGRFTEQSARRFLREVRAVTGVATAEAIGAREWLQGWLIKACHGVAKKTAARYRATIAGFLASLGTDAESSLAEVSPAAVAAWRDALVIDRGLTEMTANLSLSILNTAMKEAETTKVIEANPCTGLRFRHAEAKRQQRSTFSLAQFKALLDACAADPKLAEWRTMLLVLGLTGARQQEAAQLRWSQVDFAHGRITLVRGKQHDQKHTVPMDGLLRTHLTMEFARKTSLMVTPALAAEDPRELSNVFRRRILPLIGIEQAYGTRGKKAGGLKLAAYSLHSLRHSLSSWIDQTGGTPAERRDVLGHESKVINERYTHANQERVATALGRVSEALTKLKA